MDRLDYHLVVVQEIGENLMKDKHDEERMDNLIGQWSDLEFEICDDIDVLIRAGWDSKTVKNRIMRKMIERDKTIEEFSNFMEKNNA
jgi:hypothetical protein